MKLAAPSAAKISARSADLSAMATAESRQLISVSEFVARAKREIEENAAAVWVSGEVANFSCAASGHWYFSLRDADSRLDCVMFKMQARQADARPKDGDKVQVFGSASLYAPQARFQLMVRFLRFDGVGRLYQLFQQRKAAWREQGWFDKAAALPAFPRRVGIVCSTAGAALHDVLRTLKSRYPLLQVIIYPAPAQGADAAEKIGAMIRTAGERRECDVLLVCRGGGGIEDLWAYNEEAVVAAVVACPIPVISGIGHEIDETLTDYAADRRCPTPTAAAAAAVPEAAVLRQQIDGAYGRLERRLQARIDDAAQRLDWSLRLLATPHRLLVEKREQWQQRQTALQNVMRRQLERWRQRLALAVAQLPRLNTRAQQAQLAGVVNRLQQAVEWQYDRKQTALVKNDDALRLLSPENLLQRGYSIASDSAGRVVSSVKQVRRGDAVSVRLSDGEMQAAVTEVAGEGDKLL